jgi:glycerol kinase
VVQWLRDGLGIIKKSADVEPLARTVEDTGGVFFVPAFNGLGAPYWDADVRGTIVGITRGTTAGHIARAALNSIAYQTMDVLKAMEADAGTPIKELRVDGGATADDLLMQFQADVLNCKVIRPEIVETTALGAAYLAGLAVGFWKDVAEIQRLWIIDREFVPFVAQAFTGGKLVKGFHHLVAAVLVQDPAVNGGRRVVFLASDDDGAATEISKLAENLGFAPVKLGGLSEGGLLFRRMEIPGVN